MNESTRKAYSLADLVDRFGGEAAGDTSTLVSQVATLESAADGNICFVTGGQYREKLADTKASAVIIGVDLAHITELPRIICSNPYAYYARVCALMNPSTAPRVGIDARATIGATATLGQGVYIGPGAVVEDGARIGADASIGAGCYVGHDARVGSATRMYPQSVLYHDCEIGARGIIHSGAVIGADGFGMAMEAGKWIKIPQVGRVIVGDDVEIGANTTIDRGALDDTVIEDDVKLDNQIQIGHNCRIGAHTAIAGCVGIAGSVRIGQYCRIGGSAMIIGHLEIADNVEISAGTLVPKSIRKPGKYTAVFPISEHQDWSRNASMIRHLKALRERLRNLENKVSTTATDSD